MSGPEEIREELLAAARSRDLETLGRLCQAHRDTIATEFAQWKTVPLAFRDSTEQTEAYVGALLAVARYFEQALDDPSLLATLTGGGQPNPLEEWHGRLEQAQALMGDLRYDEAATLLEQTLEHTDGWSGSGVDRYRPITLGMLGSARFNTGNPESAIGPIEQAHGWCEKIGERTGAADYASSLYEVYRYLGRPEPAAKWAEKAAEVTEGLESASNLERARRVKAGEPLLRVVVTTGEATMELDEIERIVELEPNQIQFAFERNRVTLGLCAGLVARGKDAAAAGELEEALTLFDRAAQVDTHAPDPHYQAGLALMELGRFSESIARYDQAEALAPGWFHVREDRWLAQQLQSGALAPEGLGALRALEDGDQTPRAKVELAKAAIERSPEVPPLWLAYGKNLLALDQRNEAETALRRAVDLATEPAGRSRALVDLGSIVRDREESLRLMHEATTLEGNPVAMAAAILALALSRARAN